MITGRKSLIFQKEIKDNTAINKKKRKKKKEKKKKRKKRKSEGN